MDSVLAFGMDINEVFEQVLALFYEKMTIEIHCCRNMLLKDHNSPLSMDYVEIKRKSSFTRRVLLVTVVTALLIFMVKQPSSISGSTKVNYLPCETNRSHNALTTCYYLVMYQYHVLI